MLRRYGARTRRTYDRSVSTGGVHLVDGGIQPDSRDAGETALSAIAAQAIDEGRRRVRQHALAAPDSRSVTVVT